VLAWSATHGGALAGWAPQALLLLGMVHPIYRAECDLGFVLAMTPAFGAMHPLAFAAVMADGGVVMFHGLRLGLLAHGRWLWKLQRRS